MKNQTYVFKIDGAAVFSEIKKEERNGEMGFLMPDINTEYIFGMLYDNILWASKNAKEWIPAAIIKIGDEIATADHVKKWEFVQNNQ